MISGDRPVLVTGGLGCIGAWTVRELLADDIPVVVLDPSGDQRRLRDITPHEIADQAEMIEGDITDLHAVEDVIAEHAIGRIIHLAALQLPSCRADPPMGARVNVVGTVNVFEAARRAGIPQVVYTSSVAVFDQDGGRLGSDAFPRPTSHYGVYKLANEGTARAYWHDHRVSSIGIRPMTVYGPGRDSGLTSSPTRAILAAVLDARYHIGFGGATLFHYAQDVGRALVSAAGRSVTGSHVINLNGTRAAITDVVASLRDVVGAAADGITSGSTPLSFPDDVDTTGIELLGPPEVTNLDEGVAATVDFFRDLQSRGVLHPEQHGLVVKDGFATDFETTESATPTP